MSLIAADQYRFSYPGLPLKILKYFETSNAIRQKTETGGTSIKPRSVFDFVQTFSPGPIPDPQIVNEICRRLASFGCLSPVGAPAGFQGMDQRYLRMSVDTIGDEHELSRILDCAVYGFPCVYDTYKESVLPLIHFRDTGLQSIGTSFVIDPRILVTATHCISGACKLAIRGVTPEAFRDAEIYVHNNQAIDLAVVVLKSPAFAAVPSITLVQGNVLSDVMALGYPDVPGFAPALAAEKAMISSRLTPVRGAIASTPFEIFARTELFLITARVRGGFSGGPVLDISGRCAGVVSREPTSQASRAEQERTHRYDELGYGTAIPAQMLADMLADIKHSDSKRPRSLISEQQTLKNSRTSSSAPSPPSKA